MLSYAEKDHTLCRRGIINNSLTKPEQFERSTANIRPAWLLISRVSGRDGRNDITGVDHESPSCSELVASGQWLECEGGVISGLFSKPSPALERRRRSRHDNRYHIPGRACGRDGAFSRRGLV